jgi:hypothetical protein
LVVPIPQPPLPELVADDQSQLCRPALKVLCLPSVVLLPEVHRHPQQHLEVLPKLPGPISLLLQQDAEGLLEMGQTLLLLDPAKGAGFIASE